MNDIKVIRGGIMISSITSSMMLFVYIIGIIIELVDIIKYKNPVYRNVLGLFRFFSFDGNFLSFIFSIIIYIWNFKVYKIRNDEEKFKDKAVSHFIYIITLISACNGIIILIKSLILLFYPISVEDWKTNYMGGFKGAAFHFIIPIILTFKCLVELRKRDLYLYEKFIGGIPISIYVLIMSLLCKSKILTSFDEKDGDGLIPYPFFDFEHYNFYFCLIMTLFLVVLGFGISFLLDFLNKKFEKKLCNSPEEKKQEEEGINDDNRQSFLESAAQPAQPY